MRERIAYRRQIEDTRRRQKTVRHTELVERQRRLDRDLVVLAVADVAGRLEQMAHRVGYWYEVDDILDVLVQIGQHQRALAPEVAFQGHFILRMLIGAQIFVADRNTGRRKVRRGDEVVEIELADDFLIAQPHLRVGIGGPTQYQARFGIEERAAQVRRAALGDDRIFGACTGLQ